MNPKEILERIEKLNVDAKNLSMEVGGIVVEMRGLVIELQDENDNIS